MRLLRHTHSRILGGTMNSMGRKLPVIIGLTLIIMLSIFTLGCASREAKPPAPSPAPSKASPATSDVRTKEPNVAGRFYPESPKELRNMILGFLSHVKGVPEKKTMTIAAVVCPHAGYPYSGPVAAYSYKQLEGQPCRTVIILAPTHYIDFEGAATYGKGNFRTPLGTLNIDNETTEKLMALCPSLKVDRRPFEEEHSLEVQLPFLQVTQRKAEIVPIIIGRMDYEKCRILASALSQVLVPDQMAIVASSDMSHFHPYDEAVKMDRLTLDFIEKNDAAGLYRALENHTCELCGGFPVLTVLLMEKELKGRTKVLHYANSGDTTGDRKGRIVGYTSVVFYGKGKGIPKKEATMVNSEEFLTAGDKKTLLKMARQTLEEYLKTGKTPQFYQDASKVPENLKSECGMFVTLRRHENLRGCIGYITGREPLYTAVAELAVSSATRDPRFPPMKYDELKDTHIEISVMSPLRKVESADEIVLGKHGVLVKKGFYQGIFLPQVATETGWDRDTFLNHLCRDKAGLPADAWKDKGTELQVFTADIFEEE
jgi:MEMO1 family protein